MKLIFYLLLLSLLSDSFQYILYQHIKARSKECLRNYKPASSSNQHSQENIAEEQSYEDLINLNKPVEVDINPMVLSESSINYGADVASQGIIQRGNKVVSGNGSHQDSSESYLEALFGAIKDDGDDAWLNEVMDIVELQRGKGMKSLRFI